MTAAELKNVIRSNEFKDKLLDIYEDPSMIGPQADRYEKAVDSFVKLFGDGDISIFSAPGRTEVAGNHTDHQHGKVLAASLNLDVIGVVRKTDDNVITLKSEGYSKDVVDISALEPSEAEQGTSAALIRGVASALHDTGAAVGGFTAYTTSDVLQGSGMSSSAAFEVLVGNILFGLYNEGQPDSIEIAKASQIAENRFFGKPSGLLDQMACSVGGLVNIDFEDPSDPKVHRVDADFSKFGHSLCITDTKGSHADLTPDYAAVPQEMKSVAAAFDKKFLREVDYERFLESIPALRRTLGDRPVLRAIHFFEEEERVDKDVKALEEGNFDTFLEGIRDSGNSSAKYLQNVYSLHKQNEMSISVALAASDAVLGNRGASRVHGGGFAGTIQAFVPDDKVEEYRRMQDNIFGEGSCHVLKVRKYGGMKVL